jgi:hypothetical protein
MTTTHTHHRRPTTMSDQPLDPTPMSDESRANALRNAGITPTSEDFDQAPQATADDADPDPDGEVPDHAADVVTWLEEAPDNAEATRRANLAEAVENARTGDNRSTVEDAIASARG